MTQDEIAALRREAKKILIDRDMDRNRENVSSRLSNHLGRRVSRQQLAMALTSYRNGPPEVQILRGIIDMLSDQSTPVNGLHVNQ